jgi:hypothetical protein
MNALAGGIQKIRENLNERTCLVGGTSITPVAPDGTHSVLYVFHVYS